MGKKRLKVIGKANPGRQGIDIFEKGYRYQRQFFMKKILILIWAVFILFPGLSQAEQITDANLQNCIAAEVGRPFESLSDKDLLNITVFDCRKKGVASINGIENLANLVELDLNENRIRDISPLDKLAELKILDLSVNSIDDLTALKNLINLQRLTLDNNLVSNIGPLIGLPNMVHVSLLNNCVKASGAVFQVKDFSGLEYQHHLCSSPELVRKIITHEWLDEQTDKQCIEYDGENEYSLKSDYFYYSDGIYYMYYRRNKQGESRKMMVCRLAWNSHFEDFLLPVEKTVETGEKYTIYRYGINDNMFVQDGRIKGYSQKWSGSLEHKSAIEEIMELFKISYDPKKGVVNGSDYFMVSGKDYVIREIMDDKSHTLQFFEPGFYTAEISTQK